MKFFYASKGYGLITPDNGGKDVFVHLKTSNAQACPACARIRWLSSRGRPTSVPAISLRPGSSSPEVLAPSLFQVTAAVVFAVAIVVYKQSLDHPVGMSGVARRTSDQALDVLTGPWQPRRPSEI